MSYDPATVRAMLRQAYRRGHDDADEPAWNMHHKRCAEAGEAAINSILAAHPAPAPSGAHVGSPKHVALWDAVNALVTASGGSSTTSVARQKAVTRVEEALAALLAPAPSPAPIAALHASAVERVMRAFDSVHADDPEREERHARANDMRVRFGIAEGPLLTERQRFLVAVTEALAPTPTPAPSELHEHCVRMAMEAYDSLHADDERQRFLAAVRDRLAQSALVAAGDAATNKDAAELLSAAEWLDRHDTIVCLETEPGGCEWHRHHGASHRAPTLAHAILAAARSLGWPGGGK